MILFRERVRKATYAPGVARVELTHVSVWHYWNVLMGTSTWHYMTHANVASVSLRTRSYNLFIN